MAAIVLFVIVLLQYCLSAMAGSCGDSSWTLHGDNKCFSLFQDQLTREEGDKLCKSIISTSGEISQILTIRSKAELDLAKDLILDKWQVPSSVWLDASRQNSTSGFVWSDGSPVDFWAVDDASTQSTDLCVEFSSKSETQGSGIFKVVPCNSKKIVVCEKRQDLSLAHLTNLVYELQSKLIVETLKVEKLEEVNSIYKDSIAQSQQDNIKQDAKISQLEALVSFLSNQTSDQQDTLTISLNKIETNQIDLQNEISACNISVSEVQLQFLAFSEQITVISSVIVKLQNESTSFKLKVETFEKEFSLFPSDYAELKNDLHVIKFNLTEVKEEVCAANSNIIIINNEISSTNNKTSQLQDNISSLNGTVYELLSEVSGFQTIIDDHQKSDSATNTEVSSLKGSLLALQADMSTAKTNATALQKDVTSHKTSITTVQNDIATSKSSITKLQTDVSATKSNLASLQTDLVKVKSDAATLVKDVAALKTVDTTLKNDVAALKTVDSALKNDVAALKTVDTTLKNDVAALKSVDTTLKNDVAALKTVDTTLKNDVAALKSVDTTLKNDVAALKTVDTTLKNDVSALKSADTTLKNDVANLKKTTNVPIGFIYIQYPGKSSPQTLWPSLVWKQVTSEYAGQFFRAEGGNSAAFNALQYENAPRLTSVEYKDFTSTSVSTKSTIPVGTSGYVASGYHVSGVNKINWNHYEGIRFITSSGEVRPINKAVRIWQRTG